jgi:hypothetical protein
VKRTREMHGEYDAYYVYGVRDARSHLLDEPWLVGYCEDIEIFAADVVRNHMGNPVYGVRLAVDEATGAVTSPSERIAAKLRALHRAILEHHAAAGLGEAPRLGHFLAMSGDCRSSCHVRYRPSMDIVDDEPTREDAPAQDDPVQDDPVQDDPVQDDGSRLCDAPWQRRHCLTPEAVWSMLVGRLW